VALPDAVIHNSLAAGSVAGEPIQQAFIDSCTGMISATVWKFGTAARIAESINDLFFSYAVNEGSSRSNVPAFMRRSRESSRRGVARRVCGAQP
jgi:hypothetical protein